MSIQNPWNLPWDQFRTPFNPIITRIEEKKIPPNQILSHTIETGKINSPGGPVSFPEQNAPGQMGQMDNKSVQHRWSWPGSRVIYGTLNGCPNPPGKKSAVGEEGFDYTKTHTDGQTALHTD